MIKYVKLILIILLSSIISFAFVLSTNTKEIYAGSDPIDYWAVVIGISDYQHFNQRPWFPKPVKGYDLFHSADDANEIAVKLGSIWGADHIKLLVDSQATKSSIQNAVTGWLDSKEDIDDVVLFYFSGHGQQQGIDEYILWPYDTSSISDENEIKDDMFDSWLRCLESEQQVIIIDSCNSGGFIEELYKYGRIVVTSCSKDEESYEKSLQDHSIFTHFLLEAFNNLNNIDSNSNNSISIQEIFNWVKQKTIFSANIRLRSQNPQICDCIYKQLGIINIIGNRGETLFYIINTFLIVIIMFLLILWNKNV